MRLLFLVGREICTYVSTYFTDDIASCITDLVLTVTVTTISVTSHEFEKQTRSNWAQTSMEISKGEIH